MLPWEWTHIYIFTQRAIFLPVYPLVSCSGCLRRTQVGKPLGNPVSVSPVGASTLGRGLESLRRLKQLSRFYIMTTLFSIGMLVVFGIIATFVSLYILNFAGLLGGMIYASSEQRTNSRFVLGRLVSVIGQSYVYLAYVAFVVNWTRQLVIFQDVSVFIWIVAFLATMSPIATTGNRARKEAQEDSQKNVQAEALQLTFIVSIVAFFVFVFVPKAYEIVYGWVPYI